MIQDIHDPSREELDKLYELAAADEDAIAAYETYITALANYEEAKDEGKSDPYIAAVTEAYDDLAKLLNRNPNVYMPAASEEIEFDPEANPGGTLQ